jgi:hypothetical protein
VTEPLRVAFDTGIFVAGLLLAKAIGRSPASAVVDAARRKRFRIVVLPTVLEELGDIAVRRGCSDEWREALLALFEECQYDSAAPIALEVDRQRASPLLSALRHGADVKVAMEVAAARPDYFIHRNPDHWGPHVEPLLGGTRVRQPREFLVEIGVPL